MKFPNIEGGKRFQTLSLSQRFPTHLALAFRSQAFSGSHPTSLLRAVLVVRRGLRRSPYLRRLLAQDGAPFYTELLYLVSDLLSTIPSPDRRDACPQLILYSALGLLTWVYLPGVLSTKTLLNLICSSSPPRHCLTPHRPALVCGHTVQMKKTSKA